MEAWGKNNTYVTSFFDGWYLLPADPQPLHPEKAKKKEKTVVLFFFI